jgi:predicted DNA-binding protein (MmcQ/YjbR family)
MARKEHEASSARTSRSRRTGKRTATSSGRRPRRSGDLRLVSRALREYALAFPGAKEDFPWGERVAKVNGKVFVFLGADPVPGGPMGLSVKLPVSREEALDLPFAKPTGYGLGKAGWVSASFGRADRPPVEILKAWIAESYRAIAPRKLLAELDRSGD